MASNKRGSILDKPTRNHLSKLDAFIKAEAEASKPRQDDEFTIDDYMRGFKANGITINASTANRRLLEMTESKIIESRLALYNGRQRNLYRFL